MNPHFISRLPQSESAHGASSASRRCYAGIARDSRNERSRLARGIKGTALLMLFLTAITAVANASGKPGSPPLPRLSDKQLLTEVQHRAFLFFWEQADPTTGLTNDRAKNADKPIENTIASVASTGYALSALPIGVEHGWVKRDAAYARALLTLQFLREKMPNEHGWYYHFIDRTTAARIWSCELSSIDTALLLTGALVCGQYWRGTEVERLANALYERVDWNWMRTNGGAQPAKVTLSMGWKPETGFLTNNWDGYCEHMFLYLLGLGAAKDPLPADSWTSWSRKTADYGGMTTLVGGPIFMHQMAHGYYDLKDKRDCLGWDYWVSSIAATKINRQYCLDRAASRKTYGPNIWGLNAGDYPDGYTAFGAPGEEDGTVSPTGAIASVVFTPELSTAAAQTMYTQLGDRAWGRYGFSNGINVDRNWFGPDVIGIDLGMAMVAIEDHRTGLIWKLLGSHPSTARGLKAAGFHTTREPDPRPLRVGG